MYETTVAQPATPTDPSCSIPPDGKVADYTAALALIVLSVLALSERRPGAGDRGRRARLGAGAPGPQLPDPAVLRREPDDGLPGQGRREPRAHGRVPTDGRIVAWTIRLSKPGKSQISFFNRRLGGEASAGLTILKPGKRLFGRVMAQSPIVQLQPFFGQTVQFPLESRSRSRRASSSRSASRRGPRPSRPNLGGDTSWRASRPAGECDDTETQTAQTEVKDLAQYRCLYQRVRLTYTATLVTTPKPNKN